jgi:hypothetical protein
MKRKLQLFVSSTFADLMAERQAAVAAILKAGHIPAGMELFTAGDKSQMKTIERWIDESDVFMLILGGRYGSIEPSIGLSYTELEYDYAISGSKPFFSIVIEQDEIDRRVKERGKSVLELESTKALEQFRTKVLSNISSFFRDEKDVKLCVYESLSDLAADPNMKGWVSASEILDVNVLSEEISRLKEENERLREQLQKINHVRINPSSSDLRDDSSKISELLNSIEINVPKSINKSDQAVKVNLLGLVYSNRDVLARGISNKPPMNEAEKFFYFNICLNFSYMGLQ